MSTTFPAATGFSGAVGSASMAGRPGSCAQPPLFPQFLLLYIFPVPPLSDMQVCGTLASWCVEQRNSTLLSYRCFTGCRLKGSDKGSVSHHHDITLLNP